ncbi:MAG: SapC family protein [Cellvibrio sp.]|uniref:SapC family protein n=1 Tax=Cellvibrio sp. TaxID=1965322 RepID=UPI002720DD8E|nr:SapC family protein [Cellvibrio sp.]
MAKNELLNNVTHKDLKIIQERTALGGDHVGYAAIIPWEFRQAASCYPIFFRRTSSDNQFEAVAVFGFSPDENLFIGDQRQDDTYTPLSVARIPFAIGYTQDSQTGQREPVVHVDMAHPRVSFTEGNPVFLEHGGNSPYLENINSILAELINGVTVCKRFTDILQAEDLLEPFVLKIALDNGQQIEMGGFYTINEKVLRDLNAEQLARLHSQNFLELIYMSIASLVNIKKLINKKNKLLRG